MSWLNEATELRTKEQRDEEAKAARRQQRLAAVQAHLDGHARAKGYDSMQSMATYAASTHKRYGAEARAALAWRDAVWEKAYTLLDSDADLIAELPDAPTI